MAKSCLKDNSIKANMMMEKVNLNNKLNYFLLLLQGTFYYDNGKIEYKGELKKGRYNGEGLILARLE